MPTYVYRCDRCQNQDEVFMLIADHKPEMECGCGGTLRQIITVPAMVMGDIQPYRSQIDGSIISSRSQHKRHLKDHGCIEVGNDSCFSKPRKPFEPPPGLKEKIIRAVDQTMSKKRG